MANIASTDVVYTLSTHKKMEDSRHIVTASLVFGNGTLTYPAGGIPLLKGSLGCPHSIDSFNVEDVAASGYVFMYDRVNEKLRMFQSAAISASAHTHDILLKNGTVVDGATTRVNAGADKLGANTGGDLTITGGGANGGVVAGGAISAAAPSFAELTGGSSAPAAQTIKITVIGW